jgi:potassium-transporting ATPase KdpC subunit
MRSLLLTSFTMLVAMTLLTGVLYPVAMTVIAQAAFPRQAKGSIIRRHGTAVGSELIGQSFSSPRYFWSRLSATAPLPYNGAASAGSNLGPLNPALTNAIAQRIAALCAHETNGTHLPPDLVTASGSGLDPHISPAAAMVQIPRVAKARGIPVDVVRGIVNDRIEPRTFGVLGEPRVNVLELNLALDAVDTARVK